jgi:hypothetical protein
LIQIKLLLLPLVRQAVFFIWAAGNGAWGQRRKWLDRLAGVLNSPEIEGEHG